MKDDQKGFPGFYFYIAFLWSILLISTCGFLLYWWGLLRHPPRLDLISDATPELAVRNLLAQEGMWQSANLLVVLTLVQVTVGAFTFLYLYKTFQTQRSELRAASRTAKAAENAERPWVFFSVDAQYVGGIKGTNTGPFEKIVVTPVIKNYGKSVATQVWYKIRLLAQDPASREQTGRGFFPSDAVVALAAGDTIKIPSFPPFEVGFYFEEIRLHYVVSCTYGFSDTGGNRLLDSKTVHYMIWPTSPMEEFLYADIAIKEIDDLTLASYKEEAEAEMRLRHKRRMEATRNSQKEP